MEDCSCSTVQPHFCCGHDVLLVFSGRRVWAVVGDGSELQPAGLLSVLGTGGATVGTGAEFGSDCLAEMSLNIPEKTMLGHEECWLSVPALSGHGVHVCSLRSSEVASLTSDALLLLIFGSA